MRVVLGLLGKAVGEAREAAHVHSHGQIRAFNEAGGDMSGVRVAPYHLLSRARELRRAVARRSRLDASDTASVMLLDHCVVDIDTECVVNGVHIPVEAIGG